MANFIVSTDLLTYDASMDTGNEALYHPVTNIQLPKAPFRTWRSTTTGAQKIEMDFGAERSIAAIMLHHANFAQFDVEKAPTSKTYVSIGSQGVNVPLVKDVRIGRRKAWVTVSATSTRYLRLTLENLVAGETYFELGSVIALGTTVTLGDNPSSPRKFGHRQAHTRLEFAGGGFEINEDGEPYLEYWVENPLWDRRSGATIQGQLFDILNAGMAAPIALYENQGDATKCYLFGRLENPDFSEQYVTFETGIALREYV